MSANEELRKVVALSLVKNMGPVTFKHLLERFKSAEGVFGCSYVEFKSVKGAKRISFEEIQNKALFNYADDEIAKAKKNKIQIITFFDDEYPALLKNIYDPPILLYVKGVLPEDSVPKVAIVGSRIASLYGQRMAKQIAAELAEAGAVIVSGLALGIDAAAHEGALLPKGITCAVLGSGLAQIYPTQNKKIADRIIERGALISEYPVQMLPKPQFFPVRNRIISGLSHGVLVIEAGDRSGALITADLALEEGREVFALPGNVDSDRSKGTNSLLKQGARLVTSAQDILDELRLKIVSQKEKNDLRNKEEAIKVAGLDSDSIKLLSFLDTEEGVSADTLIEKSALTANKVLGLLSLLEIKKLIKSLPGKNFIKTN